MPSPPSPARPWTAWWPLAALALAVWVLARIRGIGLIGLDTLPILYTAEFPGALHQRLMPNHNMYRPVLSLWVWLDQLLFGLWAPGFQLSNALAYLFAGLSLGFAARRLAGSSLAGLVASLAFLLHPSQIDVVPFVERRSELLMVGFLALSVALYARLAREGGRAPGLFAPAALAVLAMGSKDNGLVALPLGLLVLFVCAPGGLAPRLRRTLAAGWPLVLATALFGWWRGRIVGGFGGRSDRDPLALLARHPRQVAELGDRVLRPEPFASLEPATGGLLAALALAVLLAWWLGRETHRARADGARELARIATPGRAVLLGLAWIEAFLITYAARGVWRIWYVLPLAAGLALVLGAAAQQLLERWRAARGLRPYLEIAALSGFLLLASSVLWQARHGVVLGDLEPCLERTRRLDGFYGELARRVDAAGPGVAIEVPPFPPRIEVPPGPGYYDNVRDVTKTTVRAFMWLAYPGERVRLRPQSEPVRIRDPGDYLLVHPEF